MLLTLIQHNHAEKKSDYAYNTFNAIFVNVKSMHMKLSKTLLKTIMVAVTVGTTVSCSKSVGGIKKKVEKSSKTDSTYFVPGSCPACGMG